MFTIEFKRYLRGFKGAISIPFALLSFAVLCYLIPNPTFLGIVFIPWLTFFLWLFGQKVLISPNGIKIGKQMYSWGEVRSIEYREIEGEESTSHYFVMTLTTRKLHIPAKKMIDHLIPVLEFIDGHQLPVSIDRHIAQYVWNKLNQNQRR